MHQYKKENYDAIELKNFFNDHFNLHLNHFNIFTDGSKTANGVGCAFANLDKPL